MRTMSFRSAFTGQQARDVVVGPSQLSGEIADVNRLPQVVNTGSARNQQEYDVAELKPHGARKGTRLLVIVSFVQNAKVSNLFLLNRLHAWLVGLER